MLTSEIKKYSRKGILKNTEWNMEKLVGKNIMNICKSKIKEAINNINCYAEKIRKDKSYNKKIESLNNQDAINEGEKFKLDILFQIHTGRKLY